MFLDLQPSKGSVSYGSGKDLEIAPSVPDATDEGQQPDATRPSDGTRQTNEASMSGHKDWKFVMHHPQDQIRQTVLEQGQYSEIKPTTPSSQR